MADITAHATPVYQGGDCEHAALFALKNATAADTIDVASWFSVVKRGGIVSATGTTIASVGTPAAGANDGSTLLTIPAGPANDGLWLIVVGVAA